MIVIGVPAGPLVGERADSVGVGVGGGGGAVTVKSSPLLTRPPTITTTLPVVAPVGTDTTMLVADHVDGVADVPLNVTMLASWAAPKLDPEIVRDAPAGPLFGERAVTLGSGARVGGTVTVYGSALLATPPTVTTTFPLVAPAGTGTPMLVIDQFVGAAGVPLKVTVLVP